MCRLSSSRQHVLLFFNYLTDNKDCLPICRVKTDLQKTKEKLKVTAKWVAKIIEKQCSIAKKGNEKEKSEYSRTNMVSCYHIPSPISIFLAS